MATMSGCGVFEEKRAGGRRVSGGQACGHAAAALAARLRPGQPGGGNHGHRAEAPVPELRHRRHPLHQRHDAVHHHPGQHRAEAAGPRAQAPRGLFALRRDPGRGDAALGHAARRAAGRAPAARRHARVRRAAHADRLLSRQRGRHAHHLRGLRPVPAAAAQDVRHAPPLAALDGKPRPGHPTAPGHVFVVRGVNPGRATDILGRGRRRKHLVGPAAVLREPVRRAAAPLQERQHVHPERRHRLRFWRHRHQQRAALYWFTPRRR